MYLNKKLANLLTQKLKDLKGRDTDKLLEIRRFFELKIKEYEGKDIKFLKKNLKSTVLINSLEKPEEENYKDLIKQGLEKIIYILKHITQLQKVTKDITLDAYAIIAGYNGYKDFETKCITKENDDVINFNEEEKIESIINAFKINDKKTIALKEFFKNSCFLYVYDQNSAEDKKGKKNITTNMDALVLEYLEVKDSFYLHNIGGRKVDYADGKLEWGDREKKTFNINFKKHRRNLYMRFNFSDFGDNNLEIILGKFIFSLGSQRQVISGSVILSKEPEKQNKQPYNYDFKYHRNNEVTPPREVQAYLVDKYFNFQKTPPKIFKKQQLKNWLEHKFGKNITKQNIITYDYLITYPISSYDDNERNNFFSKIEKILLKGLEPKENETFKQSIEIKKINFYLKSNYKKNRKKTEIIIYPKERDVGFDPEGKGDNEKFNHEFVRYIKQSSNIIIVVPKSEYKRPSSVFPFAGLCMALHKKVFIFYQDLELIPVVFHKDCRSLGVHTIKYQLLDEIPKAIFTENNNAIKQSLF
jgi:hypothetical protein